MGCGNSKTHPESGLTSAFPAELEANAKREAAEPKQEVEAKEAEAKNVESAASPAVDLADKLARAASAALAAAVKEHTPAGATPLERAPALPVE